MCAKKQNDHQNIRKTSKSYESVLPVDESKLYNLDLIN